MPEQPIFLTRPYLPPLEEFIMDSYDFLKGLSLTESRAFGLDTSSLIVEKVPLLVNPRKNLELKRINENNPGIA